MLFENDKYNYPDDIFDETKMSFGDHIDELRKRLRLALIGPVIFTVLGLLLDGIGSWLNKPYIGIGRPMLSIITDPVSSMVRDFYSRRNDKARIKLDQMLKVEDSEGKTLKEKLQQNGGSIMALSALERKKLFGTPFEMPMFFDASELEKSFGPLKDQNQKEVLCHVKVFPAYMDYMAKLGEIVNDNRNYLTALSAQEGMVVYFKVTLLCAVVLSCPWIFYHLWAFVAAGLYPHEKKYVHRFLPASVILFLSGALICQFLVLPGTIKALLAFNEYIDVDPDLRLNEWLSFAILLPLIFGVSFQTPMVMFVLNRLGIVSAETYVNKWRIAVFGLAVFSAVITPSPDAYTMLFLFIPMFALYLIGIGACYIWPAKSVEELESEKASEVAV